MKAFDVCGDLPEGVTVLQASAGTGKTFTIAALTARYVAAGHPLSDLLLVTFGRMATGELRERVRERLVSAEHGLERALAGVDPPAHDTVLALLADGDTETIELRHRRIARARADFDAATIATTHQFCNHVLSGLGTAGDVEADVEFIEDTRDLLDEIVDDLYVRRFVGHDGTPPYDRRTAGEIADKAVANPLAPLEPASADRTTPDGMRYGLAKAAREEMEARKRRGKLLTYDDLLTRLRHTLLDPARGPDACARLRQRYRIVLVDEFQDTDPVQWDILETAFGPGSGCTLVLIGDPKQAIYAFRGADVHAYLEARAEAATTATLGVNWRSDQALLDAYDALFGNAALGHPKITYEQVQAASQHTEARLGRTGRAEPLRLRVVHREDDLVELTPSDAAVQKGSGERHVAADLAADVVALLRSDATLVTREMDGAESDPAPVRCGDIAVLVTTNKQAALVRDALEAVNVPAVISGAGSVFDTDVARDWLALLEALERPTSPTRVRAAALTVFLGWSAERVAAAGEADWEAVHARLHRWAALLRRSGVATLLERLTLSERLPARLLSREDGERVHTDLRHVGQLLHAEATAERLGATALTAWLRQRITEAHKDTTSEERSRRLDSDAAAVQVLTVHRSKGLEFPIVYLPFLWQASYLPKPADAIPVFHDPAHDGRRAVHVGCQDRHSEAYRRFVEEERGEDLRLAYVALTRARHQAVVWWARGYDAHSSPLGRLLLARADDGTIPAEGEDPCDDDAVVARLHTLAGQAQGRVAVERTVEPDPEDRWEGEPREAAPLEIRTLDRPIDRGWRRSSYSAITAAAHEPRVASEPEADRIDDESMPSAPEALDAADADGPLHQTAALLDGMPAGAAIGTFVHAVLEHADFAADDLDAELADRVAEQLAWRTLDVGEHDTLVSGLRAAIETPLGALLGDVRLRDVRADDRLDELDFELPVAGGDHARGDVGLDAIAAVLDAHVADGDPLAGYGALLAAPELRQRLRGYLAGSIDVVLRLRGDAGPRFVVVDHKTNRLAPPDEPLTAWHYRPEALAEAMRRAHYPLQALLYQVALHRYLRWRLPGYDPTKHLGGVAYLFLRGMTGPATPVVDGARCGVFAWQPSAALVEALSDALDGVAA